MKIFINPFNGIDLVNSSETKTISLWINRSIAITLLWWAYVSKADWLSDKIYFFDNSLHLEFDKSWCLISIEISRTYYGDVYFMWLNIFKTKVDDLVWEIAEKFPVTKSAIGDYFDFYDLWVSFWRRFAKKPEGKFFDTCLVTVKGYLEDSSLW